jgi:amino acid transporter
MISDPPQAPAIGLDSSGISPFTSFAISLSTICIVAGGITSFHVGLCSVGGAAIGLGWPLCCLFSLIVALTMAQLASAFPRAGGPYQWAAILGGRGWGWVTACFGLAGLVTVLAAINVGTCRFGVLTLCPEDMPPALPALAVILITASQALFNHLGIRLTARLVDLSGYLILVVAVTLTGAMLVFGGVAGFDPTRLVTFTNYSGPSGKDTWPESADLLWLFVLGFLLPAYTVTGFDAPAQTAEETVDPRWSVPRGIVRSVLVSGLAGWVMLASIVLAAPDVGVAAGKGDEGITWIVQEVVPQPLRSLLFAGLLAAMYLCGLATLTSLSRMTFGFARDGGLPCSRALATIGRQRTPWVAIWASAAAATLFAVVIAYETIAAVCASFLYVAYVLPTLLGLVAYDRTWTRMGPWHIGIWFRPLALVSALGCVGLIIIGMQPPNEIAQWILGAMLLGLVSLWFGYMRRRFPGPPQAVLEQVHTAESVAAAPAAVPVLSESEA